VSVFVLRRTKKVGGHGRRLAKQLDAYEVTSKFYPKKRINHGDVVVNYGQSHVPIWDDWRIKWVNRPDSVQLSANKLYTFQALNAAGVATLKWTTLIGEAMSWFDEGVEHVYCRTLLRASKGQGIVIADDSDELVHAPLYTAGIPIINEFRTFFVGDDTVDIVQKKRMGAEKREQHGLEEVNELQRNYEEGWVFAHQNLDLTRNEEDTIRDLTREAAHALQMDWGACDILMGPGRQLLICEVNSAPALDSPTTNGLLFPALERHINAL
jgi:glutathione synthase/RimK-type ligase-like ATP-grasp enzyme